MKYESTYPKTKVSLSESIISLNEATDALMGVEHPWSSDYRLAEAHKKIMEAKFWICEVANET